MADVISFILQVVKLRLREAKELARGHTAKKLVAVRSSYDLLVSFQS